MKRRKLGFIILFSAFMLACSNDKPTAEKFPVIPTIDSLCLRAMSEWRVPGLVIGIIRNDTLYHLKAYGLSNYEHKTPLTDTTIFGIASLSKSFTALAVGIAQKEGKININNPIVSYNPEFQLSDAQRTTQTTFIDALSHRVGFQTFSGDLTWYGSLKDKQQVIDAMRHIKLTYPFRTEYGYSNLMYLVAGVTLEKVVNIPYEEYINQKILRPLGLNKTTFDYEITRSSGVATPHIVTDSSIIPIEYIDWKNMNPAGGLFSNIHDILRWTKFQWHADTSIIDPTYFNLQHSTITQIPTNILHKTFPGQIEQKGYGLGWFVLHYRGEKILMHDGGLDGMTLNMTVIPAQKTSIVIFANSGTTVPMVLSFHLINQMIGDPSFSYYDTISSILRSLDKEKSITASPNACKVSFTKISGKYYDPQMGEATISVESDSCGKLTFQQSVIFNAKLLLKTNGSIEIHWLKIKSLPTGNLIPLVREHYKI